VVTAGVTAMTDAAVPTRSRREATPVRRQRKLTYCQGGVPPVCATELGSNRLEERFVRPDVVPTALSRVTEAAIWPLLRGSLRRQQFDLSARRSLASAHLPSDLSHGSVRRLGGIRHRVRD
jgi:hypothetical protein